MDEYYWNLIMEIADEEKVHLSREEKYLQELWDSCLR